MIVKDNTESLSQQQKKSILSYSKQKQKIIQ